MFLVVPLCQGVCGYGEYEVLFALFLVNSCEIVDGEQLTFFAVLWTMHPNVEKISIFRAHLC